MDSRLFLAPTPRMTDRQPKSAAPRADDPRPPGAPPTLLDGHAPMEFFSLAACTAHPDASAALA